MSQATRILSALVVGIALGIGFAAWNVSLAEIGIAIAQPIGTAWLNALQMTIVPLVVALLVTGVAATAEAARAGRIAGRALALYVVVLFLSAVAAAILTPLFLSIAPLPR